MRAGEVAARVPDAQPVPPSRGISGAAIGVVASLGDPEQTRRVFGAVAQVAATIDGHVVRVTTDDPARAIGALLKWSNGNEIVNVEVIRPGLAAAFVALTGRQFDEATA